MKKIRPSFYLFDNILLLIIMGLLFAFVLLVNHYRKAPISESPNSSSYVMKLTSEGDHLRLYYVEDGAEKYVDLKAKDLK